MSTGYSWEGIRQVRATLLGARHVPERLCGGYVYLRRYIKCSTFTFIRGLNIRNGRIFYDTTCDIPRVCILVLGGVQARKLTQYTSRDVVTVQVTLQLGG